MRSQIFTSFLKSAVLVAAFTAVSVFAADAPKADNYPLKTCVVSGESLEGAMGGPVVIQYKGRTVKFCCPSCVPKFKANPDKYLKKLDEAAAKEKGGK